MPRTALRIALAVALAWAGLALYDWAAALAMSMTGIGGSGLMIGVLVTVLIAYALLIAVPFMPGVEIGVALLLMEGAAIAPYVYLATVAGLVLAFAVGRFVSLDWLHRVLADLHLKRACLMIQGIKTETPSARLAHLTDRLPAVLARPLVDWRHLSIAALLNLPGSVVIGGGGGIVMLAGISRLFRPGWMILTIALAVLPVPLGVWLWGADLLR